MKVKHPNVKKHFNTINFYLKIIFSIISFNKIIPVNLNDFLKQFKLQLNFINEANNLIKFGELYKISLQNSFELNCLNIFTIV